MNDSAVRSSYPVAASASDFARRPIELRWLIAAVGALALLYLAMLNPYWVPSGDGEVYTCIARSLTRGEGLKFNGFLAAIAPPGWPFVLSLAMRISPEFWFLKLITTLSMLGAMGLAFLCVRRFVSDRLSAGIVFLSGTLSSVYPLTFWMHTEAFFCLLSFAMLLIAFRISEGRARVWEAPSMLLLLAAGALTRWPGVLQIILLSPILLSGGIKAWRQPMRTGLVLMTFVVGVGTFLATRDALTLSKEEKRLALASGGGSDDVEDGSAAAVDDPLTTQPATMSTTAVAAEMTDDDDTPAINTFKGVDRGPVGEFLYRIGVAGKWFAWLLWQPTRFGQSVSVINALALFAGWLTIVLLVITMVWRTLRRDYLWIGLAIYTGGLVVLWPNPNARYFVPVAPFIILGVFLGLRALRGASATRPADGPSAAYLAGDVIARVEPRSLDYSTDGRQTVLAKSSAAAAEWFAPIGRVVARPLTICFVVSLLLANLPLLAIDISVFRSKDFYARYEAGSNLDLIRAAAFIRQNPPPQGMTIVVSERYENMNRQRWSKYGVRAMHLLTDRPIIGSPRRSRLSTRPTDDAMRKWLRNRAGVDGAGYYLFQTRWDPWRVWHFRLGESLQARLSKRRPSTQPFAESGGWELWSRENARYRPTDLPRADAEERENAYLTRVPGL